MPPPSDERIEGMVGSCKNPPSEEELLKSNPKWIKEEAILKRMAFVQMDSRLITDLFDVSSGPRRLSCWSELDFLIYEQEFLEI